MGWWCSDTAEIRFDEVRVPVANLIGPEGCGFLQIMQQFASERLSMAVQAHATSQCCVDLTIQYAKQRETEVERHYRDGRILGIGGGTTEIMTEVVSRILLA